MVDLFLMPCARVFSDFDDADFDDELSPLSTSGNFIKSLE
jgi:hypothetical protein